MTDEQNPPAETDPDTEPEPDTPDGQDEDESVETVTDSKLDDPA